MAAIPLRFWRAVTATPAGSIPLRFGEPPSDTSIVGTLSAALPAAVLPALVLQASDSVPEGTLAASLPAVTPGGLSLAATANFGHDGALSCALPLPELPSVSIAEVAAVYDLALPDDTGPGVFARQQHALPTESGLASQQQPMRPATTPASVAQVQASALPAGLTVSQQQTIPTSRASIQRAQHGLPLDGGQRVLHTDTTRLQHRLGANAQHGLPLVAGGDLQHQERIRMQHRLRSNAQHGLPAIVGQRSRHQHGRATATGRRLRHAQMVPLPVGWWQATYPWPEPEPNGSSPVHLRFCHVNDGTHALLFGCRPPAPSGQTRTVPIRRTYIVINQISLVRASDSTPLTATSISVQIDADSWAWGWDATIPGSELSLVEPVAPDSPVELIATVNGEQFRLLVERIARDRRFGQSRLRISGRGRAAMLASPYSPVVTRDNGGDRTLQQLAEDALTTNGVPLGWAVDWQAASWLVTAGTWNNTGSYIEHIQRIAEAAGAYVQADPLLDTLHVLPRYPLLPWEWATPTPDIILPSEPVVREAIEWIDKARYNRVFVSGTQTGGILGQVTRTGTAGDVVAPMITDPLITHADGARARGRAVLADTGRQARVTLDLPLLEETGIIIPGQLVRYTDGGTTRHGLVRSTSVRAQLPTARQTIELETHAS